MKLKSYIAAFLSVALMGTAYAGNPQRAGSAGAGELLINPFARSAGWGSVNVAGATGMDATFLNIAGIAATDLNTQVTFNNTQWLVGAGINMNGATLIQRVSDVGVLSMGLSAFDYGQWEVTTEDQPEGTGATISPQSLIINMGYAQKFTENIYGGVNVKLYSSSISNLNTNGVCFDAGVQYRTGEEDRFKFGITLKNVGPSITYQGDGLGITLPVPTYGVAYSQTFESRSAKFELPTQLSIGGSYDWFVANGKVTGALNFSSNSFEKDTYHAGVQYSLK
ncbi:PorV/PorQ family protein, partial [Schleiferiaceae bacterium]|nr:PorV/PorQ family protein [Schleiferiaceae bacterium]